MLKKIAIVTTHPIQYNAPWFRLLAAGGKVKPKVFYTWSQVETGNQYEPGFGKEVKWDIPLLEGYEYTFVANIARQPGSHHRKGIDNPSLIKEIEAWKPDAVLVFGWNFISHLQCIRYFHKKIPVLFRGDSTLLRKQNILKSAVRLIYLRWVYSFVDFALFVGSENKKYFKKYGLRDRQLVFAPHAIDNDRFADKGGRYKILANTWKLELGIPIDSLIVLYAGKFEEIKCPSIIIDLAKKLSGYPVHFILAGNGPLESNLKLKASVSNQITFIDFQNQQQMPVLYRLADFFILTSASETWGLGINEAMASGKAIIARNTCGCVVDLVEDGVNGFIFDAVDINGLINNIQLLVKDKLEWSKMGKKSEEKIASYSFKAIVKSIECIMEKIRKV